MKYRHEEYAESTRRAILEGAISLFSVKGYAHTSLDEVAEYARVTKGAIYHHFSNKQDVFEAALTAVVSTQVGLLRNLADKTTETHQPLAGLLNSYLDTCVDPLFSRLVLQEGPIALGRASWREFEQKFILDCLIDPTRQWMRPGFIAKVSPEMLLRTLVSAIHEMALTIADSPDRERATAEARVLINELVASLDRFDAAE